MNAMTFLSVTKLQARSMQLYACMFMSSNVHDRMKFCTQFEQQRSTLGCVQFRTVYYSARIRFDAFSKNNSRISLPINMYAFQNHRSMLTLSKHTFSSVPRLNTSDDTVQKNLHPQLANVNTFSEPQNFDTKSRTEMHIETIQKTRGKLKELWQNYGWIGIATYVTIYVSTLGIFIALFHFHMVGDFDPMEIVRFLHLENHINVDSKSSTLAMAWVTAKLTEPLRIALTFAIVPFVARLLGFAHAKSIKNAHLTARKKHESLK